MWSFFPISRTSSIPKVLFKECAEFQKVYDNDPSNIKNLKKWLTNTMEMTRLPSKPLHRIEDCARKLEDALSRNPKDHEAWYLLGMSSYSIIENSRNEPDYEHATMKFRTQGIAYLRKALELEPNHNFSRNLLAPLKYNYSPKFESPNDHIEDVWEEEYLEGEDFDENGFIAFTVKRDLVGLEEEYNINPNNADNLRRWGTALLGLSYYRFRGDEPMVMLLEAIGKLEKALELNPVDKLAKLELVSAKLRLKTPRIHEDTEYPKLLKEYRELSKEVKQGLTSI